MIEIEIDGQKLMVSEGASIIEAADDAGIYIPRFCYHKKLSVAANCRMCLVEVDKVGTKPPARRLFSFASKGGRGGYLHSLLQGTRPTYLQLYLSHGQEGIA